MRYPKESIVTIELTQEELGVLVVALSKELFSGSFFDERTLEEVECQRVIGFLLDRLLGIPQSA